MNNYKIFLLDGADYAELDVEGLDFSTTFSVANIADISQRKDSISKNIKLKATKNNNRIFGNLYNINRYTDNAISVNLGFNYKPSKKLDCLVYENDTLILKGQFQILKGNNEIYEAVITGSVVNFFGLLGDKKLEDLSFNEYIHQFQISGITNSFNTSIIKFGSVVPFELGSGYVYPFIVYKPNDAGVENVNNLIYQDNYRPAIYVNEYFKKIFAQPSLSGFTYEIKGDSSFQEEFKSLIIPNNDEKLTSLYPYTGGTRLLQIIKTTANDRNDATQTQSGDLGVRVHLTLDNLTDSLNLVDVGSNFATQATPSSLYRSNKVFNVTRYFKTGGIVNFEYTFRNSNSSPVEITAVLELLERSVIDPSDTANYHNSDNWNSVASTKLSVPNTGGVDTVKSDSLKIPERDFNINTQFSFRITFYAKNHSSNGELGTSKFFFNVYKTDVLFPEGSGNVVGTDISIGDTVVPKAPADVTQKDFLKSILKMYNLYVYTNIDNPKHIIFEKYDDYYADASKLLNSVDWSDKIDYSGDYSFEVNIEADKKYSFYYKDDSDYYNDTLYKKRYNTNYGSFVIGEQTEEKIELVFSPTPISKLNNTERIAPFIYKQETAGTSRTKSNIRILYFNGIKDCIPYTIINAAGTAVNAPLSFYGNCSHIKYVTGSTNYSYVSDLNFGLAKEYFSGVDSTIYTTPNLYSNYQNLIKELNDPNFLTVEFDMLLNEVDISNLDFKKPIYISTPNGDSYFKLLEVNYFNSGELSNVKLQKIIV